MKETNMTDKKYTKEELDGFYKKLKPITPSLTKRQVEAARENNAIKNLLKTQEEMMFLVAVLYKEVRPRERLNLFTDKWNNEKRDTLLSKMKSLKEKIDNVNTLNGESTVKVVVPDVVVRYHLAALTSPHVGDCVNLPMGCDRCFAEQFFNIPYTADWKSSDGREMITALINANLWDNSMHFEDLLEAPNNFNLDNLED